MRVVTVAALGLAVAVVALVMFGGAPGDSYKVVARFENAGQVVKGGIVEVAGKPVGKVTDVTPGRRQPGGAHARDRRGLGAAAAGHPRPDPAVRPVRPGQPLHRPPLPERREREGTPDGGVIGTEDTTSNVDLDEVFSIFDPKTRKGLRGVFRARRASTQGESERAKEGWLYLDPALVSATRLFEELNRETPELERFIDETSQLVGDVAQRRDDLAGLVSTSRTRPARSRARRTQLAEAIERLPPFLRQANTTYVNLRATLDDDRPAGRDCKPVAKKLRPYTRELRGCRTT